MRKIFTHLAIALLGIPSGVAIGQEMYPCAPGVQLQILGFDVDPVSGLLEGFVRWDLICTEITPPSDGAGCYYCIEYRFQKTQNGIHWYGMGADDFNEHQDCHTTSGWIHDVARSSDQINPLDTGYKFTTSIRSGPCSGSGGVLVTSTRELP